MGFFDFFSKDLTQSWLSHGQFPLKLNLQELSLNKIRIGDSWEKLEALGKPDKRHPLKLQKFDYAESGCSFETNNGKVDLFDIAVGGKQYDNLKPAKLSIVFEDGTEIHLKNNSKLSELSGHIWSETSRETDDEEINLVYKTNKATLYIDCSPDETIMRIVLEAKR